MTTPIVRVREIVAYENRFVRVFDDEVVFPGGTAGRYLRVTPPNDQPGVAVLAESSDGCIGLVRSYRYAVDEWQWAVPRGFPHDPDPLITAAAELGEELGVTGPAELTLLGEVTPDSGLLSHRVALVHARVAEKSTHTLDELEIAEIRWVPKQDLLADIAAGKVHDAFTLSAMTLAASRGLLRF